MKGDIRLSSGDGHIDAAVDPWSTISTSWTLHTGDGSVELHLPQGFAADLEAHADDGHVAVDFPITVSGTISRSDVRGKMNGGGRLLRIHTGDGSIHVARL